MQTVSAARREVQTLSVAVEAEAEVQVIRTSSASAHEVQTIISTDGAKFERQRVTTSLPRVEEVQTITTTSSARHEQVIVESSLSEVDEVQVIEARASNVAEQQQLVVNASDDVHIGELRTTGSGKEQDATTSVQRIRSSVSSTNGVQRVATYGSGVDSIPSVHNIQTHIQSANAIVRLATSGSGTADSARPEVHSISAYGLPLPSGAVREVQRVRVSVSSSNDVMRIVVRADSGHYVRNGFFTLSFARGAPSDASVETPPLLHNALLLKQRCSP